MRLYDVTVSVMAAATSQDQRSYIKIECQRNKTAKEIFSVLQEACGTYALSYSQVTRWENEFKNGSECVQDAHRAGRTVTSTDSYKTEQLKRLLKSDRKITCDEMAQELEISVGSVHTILRNHLKMRKVSARWGCHIAWRRIKRNVVWKWPLISFHGLIRKDNAFYQELFNWRNVGEVVWTGTEETISQVAHTKFREAGKV